MQMKRVFLIDDDLDFLEMIAGFMSDFFEVQTASDPREVLKALETQQLPDLFVTDIQMPGLTGIELLDMLRRKGIQRPVIVCSGHADSPVTREALRLGAFDLIEKPFSPQRLFRTAQLALSQSALQDLNKEILKKFQELSQTTEELLHNYQKRAVRAEESLFNERADSKSKMQVLGHLPEIVEGQRMEKVITDLKLSRADLLLKQAKLEELMVNRFNSPPAKT
jgi:FixJ family two-component response regulator